MLDYLSPGYYNCSLDIFLMVFDFFISVVDRDLSLSMTRMVDRCDTTRMISSSQHHGRNKKVIQMMGSPNIRRRGHDPRPTHCMIPFAEGQRQDSVEK